MNKKTLGLGIAVLSMGAIMITPTADAFWGGGRGGNMSQEKFEEMKQMLASFTSVEDFRAAMEAKREERKAEREVMMEKINHEVVKTDTGIIITVTSDDAEVVAKIKEKHAMKEGKRRDNGKVERIVEEIENGLKITMTTEDEKKLEKMHERADKGWKNVGKGMGKGGMKGKRRGHGKRFAGADE